MTTICTVCSSRLPPLTWARMRLGVPTTMSGFSASNGLQRENRGLTNTYYVWFLCQQRPAEGEQRSDLHILCLVSLPTTACRGRTEVWPTHAITGFTPNNSLQRENRGLTNTCYVWFLSQQQPAEEEERSNQHILCLVSLPSTACWGRTEVWPTHTMSGFTPNNGLQRKNRGLTKIKLFILPQVPKLQLSVLQLLEKQRPWT